MYLECMQQPGHAEAGSRWYRSFQTKEMLRWMRGEYEDARVDVPVRWLTGTKDPVITADLTDGYADHISDFEVELVDERRALDRRAATRSGAGPTARFLAPLADGRDAARGRSACDRD